MCRASFETNYNTQNVTVGIDWHSVFETHFLYINNDRQVLGLVFLQVLDGVRHWPSLLTAAFNFEQTSEMRMAWVSIVALALLPFISQTDAITACKSALINRVYKQVQLATDASAYVSTSQYLKCYEFHRFGFFLCLTLSKTKHPNITKVIKKYIRQHFDTIRYH